MTSRQILSGRAAELRGERLRCGAIHVVNRGDVKTAFLQPARHVRAHPTDSNESDIHVLKLATDAHG